MNQQLAIFKSLADLTRMRIIKMLQVKPLCVCEITEILGLSASSVSEHLSILREAGLIISEKKGKIVTYQINFYSDKPGVSSVISMVACLLDYDETIISDKIKAKKVDCREILARKSYSFN